MYNLGLDIGSTSTQMVVIDAKVLRLRFIDQLPTGSSLQTTASILFKRAKKYLSCGDADFVGMVATGYGRKLLSFDQIEKNEITEISCYARGAKFLNHKVRTIIDIGGQDSKVISLNDNTGVNDFVMNDKCAAGTGKFLEMVALQFDLSLTEMSSLSSASSKKTPISNICAVFAQTEIIHMIASGIKVEDIINSAEVAIADRIAGMVGRVGLKNDVMFCGGVAKNYGMIRNLKNKLNTNLFIPDHVEFVGAIGAALFSANATK